MSPQLSEAALAQELALIGERLAALEPGAADAAQIDRALGVISAKLRTLAEDSTEVADRLGGLLDTSELVA